MYTKFPFLRRFGLRPNRSRSSLSSSRLRAHVHKLALPSSSSSAFSPSKSSTRCLGPCPAYNLWLECSPESAPSNKAVCCRNNSCRSASSIGAAPTKSPARRATSEESRTSPTSPTPAFPRGVADRSRRPHTETASCCSLGLYLSYMDQIGTHGISDHAVPRIRDSGSYTLFIGIYPFVFTCTGNQRVKYARARAHTHTHT